MKKLFGEFLVETGRVKEEILLEALIDQMRNMPSVVEMVYERRLLTPSELLRALTHQTKFQVDFKRACRDLKLWSPALEAAIKKELDAKRVPIGQILVKKGLDFESMTKAFDEYLGGLTTENRAGGPQDDMEFSEVRGAILEDYEELLSDTRRAEIEELVTKIEPDDLKNIRLELLGHFHSMKGGARFIKAQLSERLLEKLEELLRVCPVGSTQKERGQTEQGKMAGAIMRAVSILWGLKRGLMDTGSERGFWISPHSKKEYQTCYDELERLVRRLGRQPAGHPVAPKAVAA